MDVVVKGVGVVYWDQPLANPVYWDQKNGGEGTPKGNDKCCSLSTERSLVKTFPKT